MADEVDRFALHTAARQGQGNYIVTGKVVVYARLTHALSSQCCRRLAEGEATTPNNTQEITH
jgi:hypothetical protein